MAAICAGDSHCCEHVWDSRCVFQVGYTCDFACPGCTHHPCTPGIHLAVTCDPCVTRVCNQDPFCCTNAWDQRCVWLVERLCEISCDPAP